MAKNRNDAANKQVASDGVAKNEATNCQKKHDTCPCCAHSYAFNNPMVLGLGGDGIQFGGCQGDMSMWPNTILP